MASESVVQFSEKPHQSDKYNFPKRSFAKKQQLACSARVIIP